MDIRNPETRADTTKNIERKKASAARAEIDSERKLANHFQSLLQKNVGKRRPKRGTLNNGVESSSYRELDGQKNGWMYGQTYNINWTALGFFGTHCGDKLIAMLDHTLKKEYKYKNRKITVDGRTDILYCHSIDLTPWPAAACAAQNYAPANDHQKATQKN